MPMEEFVNEKAPAEKGLLRMRVYGVISPRRSNREPDILKRRAWFNAIVLAAILFSSAMVFAETLPQFSDALRKNPPTWIQIANTVVLLIFTVEYGLRVWTADLLYKHDQERYRAKYPDRSDLYRRFRSVWKYIWSPIAVIDLAAILSFLVPLLFPNSFPSDSKTDLTIRFVVIMRCLRYAAYYQDILHKMSLILREKRRHLQISLAFILVLMLAASVFMYAAESVVQPEKFTSGLSGLWWAVTTVTTLGYGDVSPVTFLGRLCGGVIALAGVAAFAVPTAIISSGFMKENITEDGLKKMFSAFDNHHGNVLKAHKEKIESLRATVEGLGDNVGGLIGSFSEFETRQSNQLWEFRKLQSDQIAEFKRVQHEIDSERSAAIRQEMRQFADRLEKSVETRLGEMSRRLETVSREVAQAKQLVESHFKPEEKRRGLFDRVKSIFGRS